MLEVRHLDVWYGQIRALHNVSLSVPEGKIVTLIGANGAGKSTLLRALSGLVPVKSGQCLLAGRDITREKAHRRVALGLAQSPEGRMVFSNLTIAENLDMGAYLRTDTISMAEDLEYVYALFPRLLERRKQSAGTLSGGEQQMLAIARAPMSRPSCLLLDEPSLGIAPILTRTIFDKIREINQERALTILLVEQNVNLALEVASYGYVLETGHVLTEGPSEMLRNDPRVREAYLGGG
jgi:branched-chain amino acid transport system ATP-binding protein